MYENMMYIKKEKTGSSWTTGLFCLIQMFGYVCAGYVLAQCREKCDVWQRSDKVMKISYEIRVWMGQKVNDGF